MNKAEFLRRLPKVDIHCHLEGAVLPGTFIDLAVKRGIESETDRSHDPYAFTTLREFFDIYRRVCESMAEREDFSRVIYEALEYGATRGNLTYCEMFFSPTSHHLRYAAQVEGLVDGIRSAETDLGIQCRLVPAIDRERSPAAAVELVENVLAYRPDEVIGIGMDYDEAVGPPELFVDAYRLAARGGLHRTAHASAVSGPARNVATCLDVLGCERIDHGYNLVQDSNLFARVRDQGVPLTCCWSMSRVIAGFSAGSALGAHDKSQAHYGSHPIKRMIAEGLLVSLHTDDPAMINTDIGREYLVGSNDMGLDATQMASLCLNSVEASWLDDADKRGVRARFRREIDLLAAELDSTSLSKSN